MEEGVGAVFFDRDGTLIEEKVYLSIKSLPIEKQVYLSRKKSTR